jgi:Flp pilus assembly protein TadD
VCDSIDYAMTVTDRQVCLGLRILLLGAFCVSSQVVFGQARPEAQERAEQGMKLMRTGDLTSAEFELRRAIELAPSNPIYLADLGIILGMERKLAESNQYFEKALQFDPANISIRRDLAANQWQLGEMEKARGNLEKILKMKPRDGDSILLLGMVEENLKHYAAAARLLSSVPALVQQRPESVAALVRSYYRTQNKQKARQTLRSLLEGPAEPQKVYLGGQVALEDEDFETAEELFASIKSGYPDPIKLGYFLALARYRTGKFRECQDTLLNALGARQATSDLYDLLGWCYAKQEKLKEAVDAFDQALALAPSQESCYLDLGTVLIDHQRNEVALELAKKMVEKFPDSFRAYMMRGITEAYLGYLTDAIKSFVRAVELNPDSPEANYDLAMIQSAAGFTQEAMATLERGTNQFPKDAQHFQEYAAFLVNLVEGGDAAAESRAFLVLKTAVSLDSTLSEPHCLLGRLELKDDKASEAAKELELAAKLNPKSGKIHFALSRAYRRLGREDKAAEQLTVYESSAKDELKGGRGRTGIELRRW